MFGKEDKIDSSTIIPAPKTLKDFLHSLSSIRARLWPEAGIEMKQINEEGARKKLEELQKESEYL